ncbi:MAG: hypothetical protein IH828_01125 [Nitrospinae bacterium]|nr:hypothetical protein [Nitrospinota bacterium]
MTPSQRLLLEGKLISVSARSRWSFWGAWLSTGVVLFVVVSASVAQDETPAYEAPPVLRAADILPPALRKSPYHTVADPVSTDGHFYHFTLRSRYGRYDVVSLEMLKVRVHEVSILDRAVELKNEYEFLNAAGERIEATGEALVRTVVHPVETVKAVGQGLGERFAALGRLFKGRKRSKRRDSFVKEILLAKHKRKVADELNVDVYSSNPQIQDLLNSIATQRAAGQATVNLGAIFIPGAVGIVVSLGKFSATMNSLLRDKSPGELADINEEKLEWMGVGQELLDRFINHPEYSPRHQTFLVGALEQLSGVGNRGAVIEAALHATDEASALSYQKTAEMLASYHLKEARIHRLGIAAGMPVAYTVDGTTLVAAPSDYVLWDAETESAIHAVGKVGHQPPTHRRVFVTAGRLSPRARQGYRAWGYLTREGYRVSL